MCYTNFNQMLPKARSHPILRYLPLIHTDVINFYSIFVLLASLARLASLSEVRRQMMMMAWKRAVAMGKIRFHIKVFTDAHPAVKLTSNSKLCTARSFWSWSRWIPGMGMLYIHVDIILQCTVLNWLVLCIFNECCFRSYIFSTLLFI